MTNWASNATGRDPQPRVRGRSAAPEHACKACYHAIRTEGYCARCKRLGHDQLHQRLTRNA